MKYQDLYALKHIHKQYERLSHYLTLEIRVVLIYVRLKNNTKIQKYEKLSKN